MDHIQPKAKAAFGLGDYQIIHPPKRQLPLPAPETGLPRSSHGG